VARVAERIAPETTRGGDGEVGVIEAGGLWLWPGLVDAHVHFREPGFTQKETIASGGAAAVRGGYTSVICEPNTEPPIDSAELVRSLAAKARRESPARVYFKAAMTRGREGDRLGALEELAREPGVVALSDDGDPVSSEALMAEVCEAAARLDLLLSPHCEDSPRALARRDAGASEGFDPGAPYDNEASYIERDLELAQRFGCRIHFSHVSLARSVEVIEGVRRGGEAPGNVTFEVTPHHLLLSADDFAGGSVPRVNPPLRSSSDREAIQRALVDGVADMIATDHAPHTPEDKAQGACGLIGLETALGLVLTYFVRERRVTVADAVRAMCVRPAHVFGLPGGSLAEGQPADAVLIDPDEQWQVRGADFASLSRNTPYEGWQLRGRAVAVLVGGRLVHVRDSARDRLHGSL
jgi:dihydroorotase